MPWKRPRAIPTCSSACGTSSPRPRRRARSECGSSCRRFFGELAAWRLPSGQTLDPFDVRSIDADYVDGYDDVEAFLGTIPADGTLVFGGGLPTCFYF